MKTKLLSLMLLLAMSASAQVTPKAVKPSHSVLLGKIEEVNKNIQTQKKHHKSPVDHIPGKGSFYTWDTTSQAWHFDYASRYQYNPANQVTSEVQTDEDGFFTQRVITTYNTNGTPSVIETEGWFDNKWHPGFKSVYTYNSHDELEQYEELIYLTNAWTVMFGFRNDIKYDIPANTELWIISYWDGNEYVEEQQMELVRNAQGQSILETISTREDSAWLPMMQHEYAYTANPDMVTMIRRFHNGIDFMNIDKIIDTYEKGPDGTDRILARLQQSWVQNAWMDSRRSAYTYDNFGGYQTLEETHSLTGWQNSFRSFELKDMHANKTQYRYDVWYDTYWRTEVDNQFLLSYDGDDNLTERISAVSNDIGFLQPVTREVYEEFPVSTGIDKKGMLQLTAYPNPVKDQLQLRFSDALTGELKVSLKDMTGRTIHRQSFSSNAVTLDMSAYPQGVYILEAGTEGKNSMLKIIKQ